MEQIICAGYLHKLILEMGVCAPLLAVLLVQVVECPTAMLEVEGSSLRFQSRLLTLILTSNVVVWL